MADEPNEGVPQPNHSESSSSADPDAQTLLIDSLRAQIQDLFSQVTQLNGKLVKSYDRVSDLEDNIHVASANLRSSSVKISQLELERAQHLSALNTGLLVEKSHVTSELTRLMEKATEEAAQRGQAESARNAIEKDLDDLSASLFGQANSMVAEARFARSLSETKVLEAEEALKGAEEAVAMMQKQMQSLQGEKEDAVRRAMEMQVTVGKGKWVNCSPSAVDLLQPAKLLCSYLPYQEFLLFVAHLRALHPTSPTPPAMTTLLPLPFISRLMSEDSDPTVRLDLAPSLNWLSRRSVLAAIHSGQLTIEPMPSHTLLQESALSGAASNIPGLNVNNTLCCALCGSQIFAAHDVEATRTRTWTTSLFKRPSIPGLYLTSLNSSRSNEALTPQTNIPIDPPQVHIFRVTTTAPSTVPILSNISPQSIAFPVSSSSRTSTPPPQHPNHVSQPSQTSAIHPLCTSGWCLQRLRITCSMWAFVRTGIIEKVWEEEIPNIPAPKIPTNTLTNGEKPPIPPRRRGIWGMARDFSERAASWSESEKKKVPQSPPDKRPSTSPSAYAPSSTTPTPAPPPLPRRSQGRDKIQPLPASLPTESPKAITPPLSPRQFPLPDSTPSTPLVSETPLRTASPAPAPGGVPPPLPRRAAARGSRPLSVVGVISRPETPSSQTAGTVDPEYHNPTPSVPVESVLEQVSHSLEEEDGKNGSDPIEVTLPIDTSPPVAGTNGADEEPLLNGDIHADDDGASTLKQSATPKVNGFADNANTDDSSFDDDSKRSEDKELYVGDATWEERTWKELIRLKEEMFWARVGGVR